MLKHLTFDIHYFGNHHKPVDEKFVVPSKAGYLFMNRAAVDEEDQSEILKIFKLEEASDEMSYPRHPNYKNFEEDLKSLSAIPNTEKLIDKAKIFFKKNGLLLNWVEFNKLDENQKINTLSMISPVTNEEKQKLLEALTLGDKIETLENIISFYLHGVNFDTQTIQ